MAVAGCDPGVDRSVGPTSDDFAAQPLLVARGCEREHDPDEVPDQWSQEHEYRLIKEHPVIGERILGPIIRNREIREAIRGHHERFDGLGYPDNLRGGNIPLLARIISLVDSFDAMTSNRAYRQALSREAALNVLSEGAGKQFDPDFVPPFVQMIKAE